MLEPIAAYTDYEVRIRAIDTVDNPTLTCPLIAIGGWGNTGSNVLVKAQWHEGDQVKAGEWTVTLNS